MSREPSHRSTYAPGAVVAALVVTLGACSGITLNPTAATTATVATTATGAIAPTTTTQVTATLAPSSPTVPTSPPSSEAGQPIVVTGSVSDFQPNGDFVIDDGSARYTVLMSPTTSVVNLRGREATRLFIRVSGSVTVTGVLLGTTINAQTVLVPTNKSNPDG